MSLPQPSLIETMAPPAAPGRTPPRDGGAVAFRSGAFGAAPRRRPLGQILLDMKAVAPGDLLRALHLRDRQDVRLGDILLTRGWLREADLTAALCLQWGARAVDLVAEPPDPRLLDQVGVEFCLAHRMVPWRQSGRSAIIATARPEEFERLRSRLPRHLGRVVMALAPESDIRAALIRARSAQLARRAETRVAAAESCRGRNGRIAHRTGAIGLGALALSLALIPRAAVALMTLIALVTLIAATALKAAAGLATILGRGSGTGDTPRLPERLPSVSVMVPLYREHDIVPRLVRRLGRIDYPKELLDILLVVEEDDAATAAALARHSLPRWMQVVTVPKGDIRTKPRALNFALDFCRGSIVGVWDAEDAPEPGQIMTVVRRFAAAPEDVACLQGILDFYDARHNWLTRCFTIDYAVWFRAVLPGLARLGLVVPLGGTTLFFRRAIIERLGGWDAHNVTEDADLGVRLARHGYRTELIATVTEEEPNARVLSWLKQRSRWQKGYAITWASHMRDPARLWRDLGAWRFWGVQVLILGSLIQALLAPVLLSYWLLALGLPHPLSGAIPGALMAAVGALFVVSEGVNLSLALWAVRGRAHRHLVPWLPLMHVYTPLASLSSYKALWEWIASPFYWDKTRHGVLGGDDSSPPLATLILTDPVFLPPSTVTPIAPRLARRFPAAGRLHFHATAADRLPDDGGAAGTGPAPRAALRLVAPEPRRPYLAGSTIADAPRRPGIEFQARFEGF